MYQPSYEIQAAVKWLREHRRNSFPHYSEMTPEERTGDGILADAAVYLLTMGVTA